MKRMTNSEFISKAKNIHGDKYDYSLVEYKGKNIKIKIICTVHGIFEQTPRLHIKCGCSKCSNLKQSNKNIFITNAIKKHGNKYDYSLVNYINNITKVKIICPIHGIFEQSPMTHIKGAGCHKCNSPNICENTNDFICRAKNIHGNKYDYHLVEYIKTSKKVKIICKKHGTFLQTPTSHLRSRGCPICKNSKGEEKISSFLDNNNIVYEREKRFLDCRNILPLPFDFFLPNNNTCIEFDGIQHFRQNVDFFTENLIEIQKRDEIKNIYCKEHNIKLYRFNYKEINNIEEKLEEIFK